MRKIWIFIYQFIFIIYLIILKVISKYIIWTSNLLKTLFFINFILISIACIYDIIYICFALDIKISFFAKHSKCYHFTNFVFSCSLDFIYIVGSIIRLIDSSNNKNYRNYIADCPFTFNSNRTTFSESIYGERLCELYNINLNSRYKYQYICSYNASEDFKSDKTKDGFDKIVCVSKINNIKGNDIINKFSSLYENKDKNESNLFYCSRIDEPKKDDYIKEEVCSNENKFKSIIEYLLLLIDIIRLCHNQFHKILDKELSNREQNMIDTLRIYNNARFGNEDSDTEYDESNSNNISFDEEEDKNIIIENHIVHNINVNIKNFLVKEEKEKLE